MNLRPAPLLATAASLALGLLTARAADADSDGLEDSVETATGVYLSLNNTGTNPNAADTDGDGVPDGLEVKEGTSPVDPAKFNSFSRGLVAYWPFTHGAIDESLNTNHGTNAGAVPTVDRHGQQTAMYFNGNVKIDIPNSPSLSFGTGNITISAWIKTKSASGIVYHDGSDDRRPGFEIGHSPYAYAELSPSVAQSKEEYIIGVKRVNDDTWRHIVLVYDRDSTSRVYVDGKVDGERVMPAMQSLSNSTISRIGMSPFYSGGAFSGSIDDLRAYNRALSATEVQSLYAVEASPLLKYFSLIDAVTQNGSISGAGEYNSGATATLTAIPDPGYVFTSWTGDASGSTNPLTILMDADKTIGATFSPDLSDADNDGLTAFDEITIHHTDPAKADTDGDGLTDGWELGIGRYSVVSGGMNWLQAKADASAKGGTLATFATEREWNFALQSIGSGALFDISGLWIGATDQAAEGIWTWITGEPFTFANWATGQPDNLNDSHFAAVSGDLGGDIGKWYDFRGTTLRDGYLLETGYATNPTNPDADNDGLNDGEEQLAGSNPFLPDSDGDGLTDFQEVRLTKTHPNSPDTDGDGIHDAADDQDGDTLSNLDEIIRHQTDPTRADTDGDNLNDNVEVAHPSSYYTLVPGSFTQPQAAADATAKRGRLAQFAEKSLATDVAYRMRRFSQGHLWIGLSDATTEGLWQWSDGT